MTPRTITFSGAFEKGLLSSFKPFLFSLKPCLSDPPKQCCRCRRWLKLRGGAQPPVSPSHTNMAPTSSGSNPTPLWWSGLRQEARGKVNCTELLHTMYIFVTIVHCTQHIRNIPSTVRAHIFIMYKRCKSLQENEKAAFLHYALHYSTVNKSVLCLFYQSVFVCYI
jgi:hypothetical protein